MFGGKRVFEKWLGDSSSTLPSATLIMNKAYQVTAVSREDIMQPLIIIGALTTVIVVVVVVALKRGAAKKALALPAQPPAPPPPTLEPKLTRPQAVSPAAAKGVQYCMHCGAAIPDVVIFCTKCGQKQ